MKKKTCSSCKKEKDIIRFYRDKRSKDGRTSQCKLCRKKKYDSGPNKRDRNLKYRYGVSSEEFEIMLQSQGDSCAICRKEYVKGNNRFHIDHCHDKGHIRGILCHDCNTALGKLGDTAESISRVLKYLEGQLEN